MPASVSGEASRSGFSRSTGMLRGPRIGAPQVPRIGSLFPLVIVCSVLLLVWILILVCWFVGLFSQLVVCLVSWFVGYVI